MKKLAMFLIFIVFGTMGLAAQNKDQIKNQDKDRERIILVDGEVLQIRDRDVLLLKDKITLNDGTIVNPDGTYLTRNKEKFRLRNGSSIDMNGIFYRNEYQYQYKIKKENNGLSDAQIQERIQNRYHIMNIDGQLYQIKNQSQNKIKKQHKISNRVVVNPDGTFTNRDGKQVHLRDGEVLDMDGQVFNDTYIHRKTLVQKNNNGKKPMAPKKVTTKTNSKPDHKKNVKKGSGN